MKKQLEKTKIAFDRNFRREVFYCFKAKSPVGKLLDPGPNMWEEINW